MYLALCLIAIVFAWHAPKGQRLAVTSAAAVLLANWLLCEWPYHAGPAVQKAAIDIWSVSDLVFGLSALALGYKRWWGWALYATTIAQECLHLTHDLFSDERYLYGLDGLLLAQIAIFLLLGGPGVVSHINRYLDRSRNVRRPHRSAFSKHRP